MSSDLHLFAASINPNIPIIDLHEYQNLYEALGFLETELYHLYTKGELSVRVVHGIGKGVLKEQVHKALRENLMIDNFELEEHGGSTIVIFSR